MRVRDCYGYFTRYGLRVLHTAHTLGFYTSTDFSTESLSVALAMWSWACSWHCLVCLVCYVGFSTR